MRDLLVVCASIVVGLVHLPLVLSDLPVRVELYTRMKRSSGPEPYVIPGLIQVVFADGVGARQRDSLVALVGGRVFANQADWIDDGRRRYFVRVSADSILALDRAAKRLKAQPAVEFAGLIVRGGFVPDTLPR